MLHYEKKYLKYKMKYLNLKNNKNMVGGMFNKLKVNQSFYIYSELINGEYKTYLHTGLFLNYDNKYNKYNLISIQTFPKIIDIDIKNFMITNNLLFLYKFETTNITHFFNNYHKKTKIMPDFDNLYKYCINENNNNMCEIIIENIYDKQKSTKTIHTYLNLYTKTKLNFMFYITIANNNIDHNMDNNIIYFGE